MHLQSVHKVQWQNVMHSYEEFSAIKKREYLIMFKISAGIWILIDKINVLEWFHV